jgi:hypothetical protein
VVDLVDLRDLGYKRSINASDFADSMQEFHEKVKKKLQESNNKYKKRKELHWRHKI